LQEMLVFGWLAALMIVLISALIYLHPRVPDWYVHVHVGLLLLPIASAFFGWIYSGAEIKAGPWRLDTISWMMAVYISTLGFIIQRFSIRYLHGDRVYRLYFLFLTWTTGSAASTWMTDDLRLFSICWAMPLFGLVFLTALKKEWRPAKAEAVQMGTMFFVSSLAVCAVSVWLFHATGEWKLSGALSTDKLSHLKWWETAGISLLLILAAIIPAGQWPFHRWLLESAVTPTPVSAVMHAGLVNAGGLLLWHFSPLFTDTVTHALLLLIAFISVMIGTGVSFVQVDYKRQLVASTMAQMGMMLIQCALGAYEAAVIHLILHGLFKATLFLQSGSAVPRPGHSARTLVHKKGHRFVGTMLGLALGFGFWAVSPEEPARLLSALLLGSSMTIAWSRFALFREGRWLGLALAAILAFISEEVRSGLMAMLHKAEASHFAPPLVLEWLTFILFIVSALALAQLFKQRSSGIAARFYMRLVHFGEPSLSAVERHPYYLHAYLKEEKTHE